MRDAGFYPEKPWMGGGQAKIAPSDVNGVGKLSGPLYCLWKIASFPPLAASVKDLQEIS